MPRPFRLLLASAAATLTLCAPALAGQMLYTNSYTHKQLDAAAIGPDGVPVPLPGSPFTITSSYPDALGITPDGRTAIYISGFSHALGTRALAVDGTPSLTGPDLELSVGGLPAVSPDGRFAYVAGASGGLAFSIGGDGALTQVGGEFGSIVAFSAAITPDGRYLYLPGAISNQIEGFSLGADGTPTPLPGPPFEITGGRAQGMRITPDGKYAVIVTEGTEGHVRAYSIGSDGSLTGVGTGQSLHEPTVTGPVISPNGRFAYVSNFNEHDVHAYAIAADGNLTEIGAPVEAGISGPEAMAISDDGRFLYLQPEDGEVVQTFAIAADGSLSRVGSPVTLDAGSDHTTPLPRPAVPKATLEASTAAPGKKASFDASGSTDIGATIVGYRWDFGDGVSETTAGPDAKHVYAKAGVYTASVTVLDDAGCTGFVYTGQSAYCNGREGSATARIDTLPAISKLRLERRRGKAFFAYKLEEKAKVAFTIKLKAGKRLRKLGVLNATGKPGSNKTKLPKRLGGRRLKPGSYVATAIATDSAGGRSSPAKAKFKLKRPKR